MQVIDKLPPTEASYSLILTQTEVDFITALLGSVATSDLNDYVPKMYTSFLSIDDGGFGVTNVKSAIKMARE